ncbi:MAG: hypothetical protein Q4P05_04135 [Actinomycetaceae bacterium]|nr:hypothetical protein [Actinomycetaceae bacterium]
MNRPRFIARIFLGVSSACALTFISLPACNANAVEAGIDTELNHAVHLQIDHRECAIDITTSGLSEAGDYAVTISHSTATIDTYPFTVAEGQTSGVVTHPMDGSLNDDAFTIEVLRLSESEPETMVSTAYFFDPEIFSGCVPPADEGEGSSDETEPNDTADTSDSNSAPDETSKPEEDHVDAEPPGAGSTVPTKPSVSRPQAPRTSSVTRAATPLEARLETPRVATTQPPSQPSDIPETELKPQSDIPSTEEDTDPGEVMVGKPKAARDSAQWAESDNNIGSSFDSDLLTIAGLAVAFLAVGVASIAFSVRYKPR